MNISTLFQQGGPVMYVLLALSVLACTIILVKLMQFYRLRLGRAAFVDDVLASIVRREFDQATAQLQQQPGPVARVVESALQCGLDPRMSVAATEAEVSRVGSAQIRNLESWLRGLSTVAHLSPLLGLLGTVIGIINAFIGLEASGSRVDPALLSGGIWEALLTTAFGLTVAIPAMAAFYYLEGEVDRARGLMKDASVKVLVQFGKSPLHVGEGDNERLEEAYSGV